MSQFEKPPIDRDDSDHLADPEAIFQRLREGVAEFTGRYPVDPTIEQSLLPEADSDLIYPDMDTGPLVFIAKAKIKDIEDFNVKYDLIYRNRFMTPDILDEINQEPRRVRRKFISGSAGGGDPVENFRDAKKNLGDWIGYIYKTEKFGLHMNDTYWAVDCIDELHYLEELGFSGSQHVGNSQIDKSYIKYVFGDSVEAKDITMNDLATGLRIMGVVDLTRERLEQRTSHGIALAQFTASVEFLKDVHTLQHFGSKARQSKSVQGLADKYHDTLLTDDIDSKVEMLNELAESFRVAAIRERDKELKEFLYALSRRSNGASKHLFHLVEGYKRVYDALGYEMPPELMADEVEQPVITSMETVGHIGKVVLVEEVRVDPAKLAEISSENQRLNAEAQELWNSWRLSARQRRELGYTPMQRQLVRGYRNLTGRFLLPAVEKNQATVYIDTLQTLHSLAADPEAVTAEAIDAAIEKQKSLQLQVAQLKESAQEAQTRIDEPEIASIDEPVQHIKDNWLAYRQLILQHWPKYEGMAAVRRLDRLGFAASDASQDKH